jgi:L-asparaginase
MRPATAISADGPKNLFDAITVAADPSSKGRGVILSFNESIFAARDVTKMSTTKVNAFGAPNSGPIGQVYDGKVEYYKLSERESTQNTPFHVDMNTKLPRVDIVYMYTDAPADYINELVRQKVDGIVIAGVGNGNFNDAFTAAVRKAVAAGIAVCRSSHCGSGRVVLNDEIDDAKLGTIVSDDLNPQKARILLMLGLTQTHDQQQLQRYFFTY